MFWTKVTHTALVCLVGTLAFAQAPHYKPASSTPQAQPAPELNQIIQRMEQAALANREHYQAYVITREYRMYRGDKHQPSSTVMADISFVPPKTKEFKITDSEGSSRVATVVRDILESERQATETGQAPGAVSRDNYNFTLEGVQQLDGRNCFVLALSPKRKEKHLVSGHAWVDTETYLVRKVEGDMAKMPSWWIKSAKVSFEFGNVGGMWLQTAMTATADVRIVGPHTLQENSLKIRTGAAVADLLRHNGKAARTVRTDTFLGSFQQ